MENFVNLPVLQRLLRVWPERRPIKTTSASSGPAEAWLRGGKLVARALLVCGAASGAVAHSAPPADYVFRNGAVYTVDSEQPWAEAVAVKGEDIVYVGTEQGLADHVGAATKVVDLAGGMLLPGFVDAHVHSQSLTTLLGADLTDRYATPDQVVGMLRRYVELNPNEKVIRGTGWFPETFGLTGPTKAMIDQIVPDRPAVLAAIDGHHLWVNSKALEIAGITADTPDPEPGISWFQRLPGSREPSGFIVEGKAMGIIRDALERKGVELSGRSLVERGYAMGLPMLSAAGITTVFDAGMANEALAYDVLHNLEKHGQLPVRVFGSHYAGREVGAEKDPVNAFLALRAKYHSDLLSSRMIKIGVDASENNYTAYMLEPYADRKDVHVEPLIAENDLNDLVRRADAAGIDVHMHVVGDKGARIALDAIELAEKANGSRTRRHTLTHVILIHPDDVARFRKLGAVWQTTPSWTAMTPRNIVVERAVGKERFAERIYPLKDAVDHGVIMNFSSDFNSLSPGYTYKPLDQMQIGHTRQPLDKPDFRVMPRESQRLGVADLIRGYTINGAYMLRMESKIGSISVGKRADMVVLDSNLFDLPVYDLHKAKVMMTFMNGKVTYDGKSLSPPK